MPHLCVNPGCSGVHLVFTCPSLLLCLQRLTAFNLHRLSLIAYRLSRRAPRFAAPDWDTVGAAI